MLFKSSKALDERINQLNERLVMIEHDLMGEIQHLEHIIKEQRKENERETDRLKNRLDNVEEAIGEIDDELKGLDVRLMNAEKVLQDMQKRHRKYCEGKQVKTYKKREKDPKNHANSTTENHEGHEN